MSDDGNDSLAGRAKAALNHYRLGCELHALGKKDEAANEYGEAIRLYRSFWEAHDNLGFLRMELGDYRAALANFSDSLAVHPDGRAASYSIGECYARLHDYEQARHWFNKWLEHDPQDGAARWCVQRLVDWDARAKWAKGHVRAELPAGAVHVYRQCWLAQFEETMRLGLVDGALSRTLSIRVSEEGKPEKEVVITGMYESDGSYPPQETAFFVMDAGGTSVQLPSSGDNGRMLLRNIISCCFNSSASCDPALQMCRFARFASIQQSEWFRKALLRILSDDSWPFAAKYAFLVSEPCADERYAKKWFDDLRQLVFGEATDAPVSAFLDAACQGEGELYFPLVDARWPAGETLAAFEATADCGAKARYRIFDDYRKSSKKPVKAGQGLQRAGGWIPRVMVEKDYILAATLSREAAGCLEIGLFVCEDHLNYKQGSAAMFGLIFTLARAYSQFGKMELRFVGPQQPNALPIFATGFEPVVPKSVRQVADMLGVTIAGKRLINDEEGKSLYRRIEEYCGHRFDGYPAGGLTRWDPPLETDRKKCCRDKMGLAVVVSRNKVSS